MQLGLLALGQQNEGPAKGHAQIKNEFLYLREMTRRRILLLLVALLVLGQFYRIDKTPPASDAQKDFLAITNAPEEIKEIFTQACYDCHSHQSEYPWYTSVFPVSVWIRSHIRGARQKLNFSTWGDDDAGKQRHNLEDIAAVYEDGRMPPSSFKLMHPEAKLSPEQVERVLAWTRSITK